MVLGLKLLKENHQVSNIYPAPPLTLRHQNSKPLKNHIKKCYVLQRWPTKTDPDDILVEAIENVSD